MLIWLAVIIVTVFLDQLTKYLTVLHLKPIDTLPIIEDVLHLTYVENTGAAFGMMKDQRWLFMIVSTVAIIALLIYLFKKKTQPKLENLAIAFIVGGGIGNMIDRVVLGYVVDMIDFRLINFAVFNAYCHPEHLEGYIFSLFGIGIAAAETAVAIAIIINVYRNFHSIHIKRLTNLKH